MNSSQSDPAADPTGGAAGDPAGDPAGGPWGRVGEDGTVYVRDEDGERAVGQWPEGDPAEALAFFQRRYDGLAFEVELLEQRVKSGALSPDEAASSVRQVRETIHDAKVVGDLPSLTVRLDRLGDVIAVRREQRKAERAKENEATRAAKEQIVAEAEQLSSGGDWRNGANRMRDLLERWKALPRLDKRTDDALWHQFSGARTAYTRRRKTHFAELNEQRDAARVVKERLVAEAEAVSASTDWGATSGTYRDLMQQWKAAGPAPKGVDDHLWGRFRRAQDTFFGARDAVNAELDAEFVVNAERKEALLVEAEALLPVTDLAAARDSFRAISERWDAIGKVPKASIKDLEARMRTVEATIRGAVDDQWRRSNPEARARAADTVAQLESLIGGLEAKHDKAVAAGDQKVADELTSSIEARRSWLAEAQRALDEFSA